MPVWIRTIGRQVWYVQCLGLFVLMGLSKWILREGLGGRGQAGRPKDSDVEHVCWSESPHCHCIWLWESPHCHCLWLWESPHCHCLWLSESPHCHCLWLPESPHCHCLWLSESPPKISIFLPCVLSEWCQNDVGKNCCCYSASHDQADPCHMPGDSTHFDRCIIGKSSYLHHFTFYCGRYWKNIIVRSWDKEVKC